MNNHGLALNTNSSIGGACEGDVIALGTDKSETFDGKTEFLAVLASTRA